MRRFSIRFEQSVPRSAWIACCARRPAGVSCFPVPPQPKHRVPYLAQYEYWPEPRHRLHGLVSYEACADRVLCGGSALQPLPATAAGRQAPRRSRRGVGAVRVGAAAPGRTATTLPVIASPEAALQIPEDVTLLQLGSSRTASRIWTGLQPGANEQLGLDAHRDRPRRTGGLELGMEIGVDADPRRARSRSLWRRDEGQGWRALHYSPRDKGAGAGATAIPAQAGRRERCAGTSGSSRRRPPPGRGGRPPPPFQVDWGSTRGNEPAAPMATSAPIPGLRRRRQGSP